MTLDWASEPYGIVHIDFRDLKVTFQFSSQNCDFWTSDLLGNRNAFMTHFVFFFLQNIHHWSFTIIVSIDHYCKENAWELDGLNFDLLRKIRQFSKLLHGIPMLLDGYGNWKRKLFDLQSDLRDSTELYRKRPSELRVLGLRILHFSLGMSWIDLQNTTPFILGKPYLKWPQN